MISTFPPVMWLILNRYLLLVIQEQKPGEVSIFLWKLKTSVFWCGQSAWFHLLWVWQYHSLTFVHQGAVYNDKCLTLQEVRSVFHVPRKRERLWRSQGPKSNGSCGPGMCLLPSLLTVSGLAGRVTSGTPVFSRKSAKSTQTIQRHSCPHWERKLPPWPLKHFEPGVAPPIQALPPRPSHPGPGEGVQQ